MMVSFVPVRVLHKNEKILGRKHIYLPHAQTAINDSKVKLFLKQGISHHLGRDAVVRFECENSAIDQFHVTAAIMVQRSIGVKKVNKTSLHL